MYTHHNTYNKILLNNLSWLLHDCECTCIHKLQQLQQDPWCLGYCNQHILVNSHCNTPCNKHYDTLQHANHTCYILQRAHHACYILQHAHHVYYTVCVAVAYIRHHACYILQHAHYACYILQHAHQLYYTVPAILTSDLTHSHAQQWSVEYALHAYFICVTRLSYALHACFICVTRRIESSVLRVPWAVHTCHLTQILRVNMPHSYAWHVYLARNDAFIYYVIDMFYLCNNSVKSTPRAHTYIYVCIYVYVYMSDRD